MGYNSSDISAFKNVWVFCEQRQGVMMPTTFELISEGRKLADELNTELCGVLLGDDVDGIAAELGGYGADKVYVYNSPLLKALLGKLEEIDFVALGCPEAPEEDDEESGGGVMYAAYSEDSILLQSNVSCCFGGYTPSNVVPILMGLDADTPMPLVLRTTVAFVNPYTQHPDVALAFMETLSEHLTMAASYSLDPSLNEPVRGAQNEQNLADAKEMLENAQKQLEEADEADRQMLEENLRYMQENVDYWENDGWEVSQKTLDWYRGHDDNLALERVNWLYTDDTGEASNLIMQYMDGAIGIDEMLSGIDRKAQMMRLEGN